ncbi:MAG: hypothetical protein ABI548_11925 [Polyangiaceae bacterium]
MSALKLAERSGIILVISAIGVAATAVGCSSDDETPAAVGKGGEGGEASGGKGDTGGGAGEASAPVEAGAGGTVGGDGGAAGAAGALEEPFTAHLSPAATPQTFAITPGGHDRFYGVTFDSENNIYAVGVTSSDATAMADYSTVVAKFSPEGVLDKTFGTSGYAIKNVYPGGLAGEFARGIGIQSNGKIVVSEMVEHVGATDARDRDAALLRFNADGSLDKTFGKDGVDILDFSDGVLIPATATAKEAYLADSAWGFALYPDDRIVVEGGRVAASHQDTDFVIIRLSKDGLPDDTFGTHGVFALDTQFNGASNNASPRNLTLLPGTQGIIGAGYQPIPPADTKPCVFKVTDKGELDTTFGVDGVFQESVFTEQTETYAAVSQSDGKLVTAGYARELSTDTTDILSLRLNADGSRDMSYGTNGAVKVDIGGFADNARRILTLPNDHIVIVGGGRPTAADVDGVVMALTPDGKPETTFSATGWKTYDLGGPADFFWSVALSPSQTRIAVVGIQGGGSAVGALDDDAALMVMKLVP